MLERLTSKQKTWLQWLAFFIVVGVGFMLVQPQDQGGDQIKLDRSLPSAAADRDRETGQYEINIENRLQKILQDMAGVGRVQVMAVLEKSARQVVAKNITDESRITEETDQSGGNRVTTDSRKTETPITLRSDLERREIPLVIETVEPVLKGVLVLADGADDPDIRWRIARAVQTVVQLPLSRIEVMPKEKER